MLVSVGGGLVEEREAGGSGSLTGLIKPLSIESKSQERNKDLHFFCDDSGRIMYLFIFQDHEQLYQQLRFGLFSGILKKCG